jgi:hypothetical protein
MSRELVSAMRSLTLSEDCHCPAGRCSTKPRSVCTGPPKYTGRPPKRASACSSSKGMLTRSNKPARFMSIGRLTMMPMAPSALCSQM